MKLTIKTLQNTTFKVEITPDKTVKELKERIEEEQGKSYPSSSQKLIYNGKILVDDAKLTEYEFDEKKFVVLMMTRPPPAAKPVTSTEQLASTNKQKSDEKPKPNAPTSTTRQPQSSTTATVSTSNPVNTTSATTTTSSSTSTQQQPTTGRTSLNEVAGLSMGEPQLATRLASLMTQPVFRQMQDLIQQNPHLLSSTIESLAASDPEMHTFISENPDVFVNALNHPPLTGMRSSGQQSASGSQRTLPQGRTNSQQQPVVDHLVVSEHDKEAIERLKELGFSELLAVQAYMACDKDEQLAANLLFQMEP